jgi:heterotetrameric sarcosine oxidase gamma subunit
VADFVLSPRSGLELRLLPGRHGARINEPGVTVTLRTDLALAVVMARNGKAEDLRRRMQDHFGLVLPMTARHPESGGDLRLDGLSFIWAGPGRWLARTPVEMAPALEATLRAALSGLASVSDQTDGRCVFHIGGPRSREILGQSLPVDIDARLFRPGDTALTLAGHINVHFWQIDLSPAYEFAVPRSFAASFCEWLFAVSAKYGVVVGPA